MRARYCGLHIKIGSDALKRILNYVGSKWNIAKWIVSQMPDHEVYLEPFFGSGAVLFNKPQAKIETVNDIDGNIVNLFKMIRECPGELARLVEITPYSREEYLQSFELLETDLSQLERARVFLIRCWMGRGGKTSDRTGWRHNVNPSTINALPDWNRLPNIINESASRLKNVQIENQDANTLIERYNRKEVLIYADPPYVLDTRSKRHYKYEMSHNDHSELLEVLIKHSGPALISGYEHPLYDLFLVGWHKEVINVTAEAAAKRKEVLWINPIALEKQNQMNLFSFSN